MNFKLLAIILISVIYLFNLLLMFLQLSSTKNEMPENVKDIYSNEEFENFKKYNKEHISLGIVSLTTKYVITVLVLIINGFSWFASLFNENMYVQAISCMVFSEVIFLPFEIIFNYISQMKIEEKYGFNKTTNKTFIIDTIKNTILSLMLDVALICAYAALYTLLKEKFIIVFTIVVFIVVLAISFLYPFFAKIFNKFTPLEEGQLKDELTALLTKHGYNIKEIKVMDASTRTTKSNAYFAGFGKTKSIVLYDTIIKALQPREICAVFAHELGHGLHKDTLKNSIASLFNVLVIALELYLVSTLTYIFKDFGFDSINYGFAFFLLSNTLLDFTMPLIQLVSNAMSRNAEYKADKQAVLEGYGKELISGLKVISKENYANLAPHPLLVKLQYSHPTLSQRIQAIEKELNK